MAAKQQQSKDGAWTRKQLLHFEQRLVEERKRAIEQMGQFDADLGTSLEEATGELTTWRFHMADAGTETFDREQGFLMASREGQLIRQIDQGLRRLYGSPDTFGICEQCGTRIAFERLDAIPYVPRCVECKQEWESGRGGPAEEPPAAG